MKMLIPTQHGDAKQKRAPRSAGIRKSVCVTPHDWNCNIWIRQHEQNLQSIFRFQPSAKWTEAIKLSSRMSSGCRKLMNLWIGRSKIKMRALLPGALVNEGCQKHTSATKFWGESLLFFANNKYVLLWSIKNMQNSAAWQYICVPVQQTMIPGSCKFAPGITFLGIFRFRNTQIKNMHKTNVKAT